MRDRLPLAIRLALRSHGGQNRALSLLALSSIATAVAMASGLEMSARSVEAEIGRTGDELAGAAQLEVTAGGVGVPEALLARVTGVAGVRAAVPYLETTVRAERGERLVSLHIIGVDLLEDAKVREYHPAGSERVIEDPLRLLAEPGAVVLNEALAHELGVRLGDALPVTRGRQRFELVVRGLLAAGGVADAFGGRIAVTDAYLLQTLLGREGWFDRIEVVAEPGADLGRVTADLARAVAGEATVRPSATRGGWVESALATVRLIVAAMVMVAIGVASLLSHAAMSLFVDRRARELSLLRLTGLEARRVKRFLHVDALLLAALGTAAGIAAGIVFSRGFVALLSGLTDFLEDVQVDRLELEPATIALAAAVGCLVALAGMVPAARRAVAKPPLEQLALWRSRAPQRGDRRVYAVQLALALAWLAVVLAPLGLAPLVRIGAILALGLAFLVFAGRSPLPQILVRMRPGFERVLPGLGRLVGASLVARPLHTGLHIAALAGVVAGVAVTGILEQSLASTLDGWTASQFPSGVMITPDADITFRNDQHIPADVVSEIRATAGVSAVFEQYADKILYRGEEVLLSASDMQVMAEHGRLPAVGIERRALATAIAAGGAAVSDGFAKRFAVASGDELALDTPAGPRRFQVAGILRDYAGPGGSVNIDLAVYDRLWQRPGARNLVIWTDGDPAPVVRRIEERVGSRQSLFFAYGADLERFATRLLGRFTRILDLVAGLTSVLGGLAVLNLLLGALAERRRELGLLRSTGATRGQIGALVLLDGLLAGVIGGAAGLLLGVVCAYPLATSVVSQALGWSLDFSLRAAHLALLLAGVALASLVAAVYPAWLARRVLTREVLAPE